MSAEKTLGIVLRVVDFSETSCVVTLFTREFGKVGGLAKGARRPKGPFESALDLLALVRLVFLRKSSDALDLLTEAKLERRFRGADRSLARLYAGYYVAELLDALTDDDDPHPELFDVAEQTLRALETAEPSAPIVLRLELAAMRVLGHWPSLDACVECGAPVAGGERASFSLVGGGVLCPRCRPGKRQVVSVSAPAMQLLVSEANARTVPWTPRAAGELRGLISSYLTHWLGRRLKMHEYMDWIWKTDAEVARPPAN
jgi:DNA repair protein RecO (recombination protein O)